jgi:riboflavin synthase
MFTGIVEELGKVKAVEPGRLVIVASKVLGGAVLGGSVSVNGACLTMTSITRGTSGTRGTRGTKGAEGTFSVDVVPETLRRTNLGLLKVGDGVNLERPLAASGRLDGHIVQGHVDGTAKVASIGREGAALLVRFRMKPSLARYVVEKGFVAVDGTSLTVVHSYRDGFSVTIIPFTLRHTTFGNRKVGDTVNIEVDILAKYVERLVGGGTSSRQKKFPHDPLKKTL